MVRAFGWFLRKVWKQIYQGIHLDENGLDNVSGVVNSIFINIHR